MILDMQGGWKTEERGGVEVKVSVANSTGCNNRIALLHAML